MESLYSAISRINIRRLVNDKCVEDPPYSIKNINCYASK